VHTRRSYTQHLRCTSYAFCPLDQYKSTAAKATHGTLMKLTPDIFVLLARHVASFSHSYGPISCQVVRHRTLPSLNKSTVCVTELDQQSELLIFESILTSFKPSIVFGGSWGSTENWLVPKIKPSSGNLACPNL